MNNIIDMWKKFKENGNLEIKNELIENYLYLVKIVSGRLYNNYNGNVEFDDLLGYGVFGLIDAIEKFDVNRNNKFETYAQIRIRGSIIDNLRKLDWIPRSLRQKSKLIEDTISKLESKYGNKISNEDISLELNMSVEEVEKTLSETSTFNLVSLDEVLLNNDINNKNEINNPENVFENKELIKVLSECINSLSKKEKLVISLYYYEELTYKEISKILDVSESRISQIHSKATLSLRSKLLNFGIYQHI